MGQKVCAVLVPDEEHGVDVVVDVDVRVELVTEGRQAPDDFKKNLSTPELKSIFERQN